MGGGKFPVHHKASNYPAATVELKTALALQSAQQLRADGAVLLDRGTLNNCKLCVRELCASPSPVNTMCAQRGDWETGALHLSALIIIVGGRL